MAKNDQIAQERNQETVEKSKDELRYLGFKKDEFGGLIEYTKPELLEVLIRCQNIKGLGLEMHTIWSLLEDDIKPEAIKFIDNYGADIAKALGLVTEFGLEPRNLTANSLGGKFALDELFQCIAKHGDFEALKNLAESYKFEQHQQKILRERARRGEVIAK